MPCGGYRDCREQERIRDPVAACRHEEIGDEGVVDQADENRNPDFPLPADHVAEPVRDIDIERRAQQSRKPDAERGQPKMPVNIRSPSEFSM